MVTRVSFVDDDLEFSKFLRLAIEEATDLEVLNSADSQASGLKLLHQNPPDVFLIDLGLPDGSGLEVIRQAHETWPQCPIMVISLFGDQSNILAAIKAGAQGYLLKGMASQEIAEEIRVVHQGGSAISPSIAKQILLHLRKPADKHNATSSIASGTNSILTEREHEVLILANKGLTYIEVAASLGISTHTVRTHVKRAYQKLQVSSKTEALYELQRTNQKMA